MAKQTTITIETDSLLILRGRSSTRAWCPLCAAEVEMIALEDTGVISNLERPALEEWLNSGELHRFAGSRWLGAHVPEFTACPRAEHRNQLNRGTRGSEINQCQQQGDDMKSRLLFTTVLLGSLASSLTPRSAKRAGRESQTHSLYGYRPGHAGRDV